MLRHWTLLTVLLVAGTTHAADEADDDPRSQIRHLLTLAAEPSAKNLDAVEDYFRSLPAASHRDGRLKYAYAVALIRQRRLHESAKLIDALAEEQPQQVCLWRDRIWLALVLGQKTAAMTEIEHLAAHAAARRAGEHQAIDDSEMAEFFGAVCGFISGPWSHKVHASDVQNAEDHLRSVFDDESRAVFDRSKAKVIERYEEMLKTHEERAEDELQARFTAREAAEQSVDLAAKQLDDKQQALKSKEAKRNADAKAKIDDLDQQLRKIDDERQALLKQLVPLEAQRAALVSQMKPDPMYIPGMSRLMHANMLVPSSIASRQINRAIMQQLTPIVVKVTELEARVGVLDQREQELRFEQQATDIKRQVEVGKLSAKEQSLEKDRKRVQKDARRVKNKPLGSTPRLRAQAEQLTNFSTYVPFPFEREKERLLSEAPKDHATK